MKKRILSLLLVLLMVVSLVPTAALADKSDTDVAYAVTSGNIYFDKSTGTITDCDYRVTEAVIPTENEGVSVTSIGDGAFNRCSNITSVTIPDSVTSIGEGAFRYCESMANVTIPDGIKSIGGSAFFCCESLTSVEVPSSVTSIGGSAFWGCKSLTSITIPNSVSCIGNQTFRNCTSLTSVEIPNSVTSIDSYSFQACESLTSIKIPNSVTSIGQFAFSDCTSLTSLEIPDGVTYIRQYTFQNCTSLVNFTIPDNVGIIEEYAFSGCAGLVSVEIPDRTSISKGAFFGCAGLTSINIPSNVWNIYDYTFQDCTSLETLTIPNGVSKIGNSAFSGCKALTSVSLPKNVKTIGNAAFRYCDNIKDVYYAGSETEWNAITIKPYNEPITNATIHYVGETHTHNYVDGVCTICGAKDPNYVPPHTHDYNAVVTAPTCTSAGYTTYTCTGCGHSYKDNYKDALGHDYKNGECLRCHAKDPNQTHEHDYKSTVTKPTCTEKGYTTHTCACGDSYVDSYKDALGHLYIFGKCIRCGEKEDNSETHKHDYKSRVVEPTCTEGGYTLWECECGKSYETLHTKALGHEYKDGLCIRCGAKDPNAHTHKYVETVTKPTCTEKGYTTYTCSVCNDSYKGSYTDALGHSYVGGVCTRCNAKDPDYKPAVSFTDVPSDAFYANAVKWAVENEITTGVGNNRFDPNGQCTRGQVVTFLWRAAGKPTVSANVSFSDVQPGAFYYEAVKWAVANGITQGVGGNRFAPNDTCTRGQVATFLHRAANSPSVSSVSSFTDVPATAFYYNAVNWAVANGITNGTGNGRFSPNDTCTRAQVVTFLYRAQ